MKRGCWRRVEGKEEEIEGDAGVEERLKREGNEGDCIAVTPRVRGGELYMDEVEVERVMKVKVRQGKEGY